MFESELRAPPGEEWKIIFPFILSMQSIGPIRDDLKDEIPIFQYNKNQ